MSVIDQLRGGLIVSCQAPQESPLRSSALMARMAEAAILGGAVALRVNSPEDIAEIRAFTDLPIIGLHKVFGVRRNIITPTFELAAGLVEAGADIIAIDATDEVLGDSFELLRRVRTELGCSIMADVSTLDEGVRAWNVGVDIVGTTLSGYTPYTLPADDEQPDIQLVRDLRERDILVVAEGRYRAPEQLQDAFRAGAHAVVVGAAITDPVAIARRFAARTPRLTR
ncbi:N-acetylmannosamine-6-phosphate 2-epimerase [Glaciibacter psychrotolerans]|uniref:N-acylglucosamine-6-phosphate 2-epimerase n=1 Tax=Glaciibacter psychrotolerans TaxID=670054 RepID=A0A7Z0EDM0_9MICO|nr:N-acetylmannosamine-6-phosphate 2-epimerase [Leifsonia psychrotolerans]NYJ19721.1 N-acylglucosamine-6-phosphate 2-epimerase [Leifsonia psychrotolerans]